MFKIPEMKTIVKSRISKMLLAFSMFAMAALPVLANANSDGSSPVDSSMSPGAVVGGVALIIAIVVVLAAKGGTRATAHK